MSLRISLILWYQLVNNITTNYIVKSNLKWQDNIELKNETKHEQLFLKEYPKSKFHKETLTRQLNSDFYKFYPWTSYSAAYNYCIFYPCTRFNQDISFMYSNWKKPTKLVKHNKSQKASTQYGKTSKLKASEKTNTSVIVKLDTLDFFYKQLRILSGTRVA